MKFKIGDRVKIIDNKVGHCFNLGEIVRVSSLRGDGSLTAESDETWWYVSNDDIELFNEELLADEDGFKREDKSNKIDFTLIPTDVLEALAIHYTEGAKKHGIDNWKKSKDMETFKKASFRHLIAILNNLEDEDHYSALIWNVACLKWNKLNDLRGKKESNRK